MPREMSDPVPFEKSGLCADTAVSSDVPAESSSSPTDGSFASGCSPPRLDDAVTFSYKLVSDLPGEDFHLTDCVRPRAHRSVLRTLAPVMPGFL